MTSPAESVGAGVSRMRALLSGYMVTQCLATVARLGIADELTEGPVSVSDLAARKSVDPDALFRVLRALASLGVFEEIGERRFAQTALSSLLREDGQPSLRHLAILFGGDLYRAWAGLSRSVETGEPVFAEVFGRDHFGYLAENPAALETFTRAMAGTARGRVEALLGVDWSGVRSVVDVGGGDGTLVLDLLARVPHLEGIVFDRPEVIEAARATIARAEPSVASRCTCAEGSFLEVDPPSADAYVLARVLHNWNDETAKGILRRVRRNATEGARLVILDDVLSSDATFETGKLLDLQMLVVLGGRERTEAEWEALLRDAGFALTREGSPPKNVVLGRAI